MQQSGYGRWKLEHIIRDALQCPPAEPDSFAGVHRVLFDGTYLHHRTGVVVCMDGMKNEIIAGRYDVHEGSSAMVAFLASLKAHGLMPASATIDGLPAVAHAFRALWPGITIQRCLVHIQRQGLMWCRRNPKRKDACALRLLFLRVLAIETVDDRDLFLSDLQVWEEHYGSALAKTTERGWVVSDLIRARSMLHKAIPDMFHFLACPEIPRTTNALEGYFSRLKGFYRRHRGLLKGRRTIYFLWHFFLHRR